MMRVLAVLAVASVAACAPGMTSAPDSVGLKGDTLTLRFLDGTVCRATVPGSGSGDFPGCRHAARYDLVRAANPGPVAEAAPSLFEPIADIAITTADGRVTRFKTPESRGWRQWRSYDRDNL